jgi:D-galactarolactone cycloisomerase
MQDTVTISSVQALVFRVPLAKPVSTSFGTMLDRPAVFVRLEDDRGTVGWGEIWCNWPACGAEHRARLLVSDLAPRSSCCRPAKSAPMHR